MKEVGKDSTTTKPKGVRLVPAKQEINQSNDKGKDAEGSRFGFNLSYYRDTLQKGLRKAIKKPRILCVTPEVRTVHLQNTNKRRYILTQLEG
jgi:hypothetical protein